MKEGYQLWVVRYKKQSQKVVDQYMLHEDRKMKTFSMTKVLYADLVMSTDEYKKDILLTVDDANIVNGWWVLYMQKKSQISLRHAVVMMLVLSDNVATNMVTHILKKYGSIQDQIQQTYQINNFVLTDEHLNKNFEWFQWTATTSIHDFLSALTFVFTQSWHRQDIKRILNHQYIQGRWLRYIDEREFVLLWNKTWQWRDTLNDCWFLETHEDVYIYVMSYATKTWYQYEYSVENPYAKKMWKDFLMVHKILKERMSWNAIMSH